MNTFDLLSKLRINADVFEESETDAQIGLTAVQYEKLCKLLSEAPEVEGVSDNRLRVTVNISELEALVEAGVTANRAAAVEYNVRRATSYYIEPAEEIPNDLGVLIWNNDDGTGEIQINGSIFKIGTTTSGELMDEPSNPDRQLYFIETAEGPLHSGSVSGLIKRLVNYGEVIEK